MEKLHIQTRKRNDMIDITTQIQSVIDIQGWMDGAVLVYCPHTTGAITVNEGADPDVTRDILINLSKLIPHQGDYRHFEGNSDSHIKTSLFGPDQLVIVEEGMLQLGTWQKIFFCEFDGPRERSIWVKFLGSTVPTSR